jgi:prophage regulatory protein
MHDEKLLRVPDVTERLGVSRSKLYSDIASGLFIPPIQAGVRVAAWPSTEVGAIVAARCACADENEIRQIVRNLIRARARKRAALTEQIAATV